MASTFLLVWNPKRKAPENVAGLKSEVTWSCGNTKKIHKGDRLFMIRLGAEPKGIFASGAAISDSYQNERWSKTRWWVDLKLDKIIDPDKNNNILEIRKLVNEVSTDYPSQGQPWIFQRSGVEIPSDAATKLEKVWREYSSASNNPNYWLWMIMEWEFPALWDIQLQNAVAAQHYPENWRGEARNIKLLQMIKEGDFLIAGLGKYRFVGYGEIKSAFGRTGPSLKFKVSDDRVLDFKERFDCNWTAIPRNSDPPFEKIQIDGAGFVHGACVKQIPEEVYVKLRERLNLAGAKRILSTSVRETANSDIEGQEAEDGKDLFEGGDPKQRLVNYYEREPALRNKAIEHHGTICKVCSFDFTATYGERGKGYIDVHHVVPISSLKKKTKVDPINHMTVLCPNCHRMIHRRKDEPLTVEQLKEIWNNRLR
ncbi:MAG: HNH endonuclease [Nitrospirota bacterium]